MGLKFLGYYSMSFILFWFLKELFEPTASHQMRRTVTFAILLKSGLGIRVIAREGEKKEKKGKNRKRELSSQKIMKTLQTALNDFHLTMVPCIR